ncbi:MAG TPA: beta-ketoacyl synthase N-terminal-like domain-containing protein [Candidatus Binatia bacterium]|nr:beta-ketoacyl synthase N-terminal-like domain-containing protein [Candidatus Binatia bacterium]
MTVSLESRSAAAGLANPTPTTGTTVEAVAVLTGWGHGIRALPADAARAAAGRAVIPLFRPVLEGERFRRATRECLLGVAAVDALLRESDITRDMIRGSATALIYVTGAAYGASNQAFIVAESMRQARTEGGLTETRTGSVVAESMRQARTEGGLSEKQRGSVVAESMRQGRTEGGLSEKRPGSVASSGTLHFPYTAPSAMAGEVAIEFGLTGPYGILIGGAAATIDALWQATRLLAGGRCERALVLAVETFEECAALYARGRWLVRRPLVEAAACALLVPGALRARYDTPRTPSTLETLARVRAGETLACAPLIALALARDGGAAGSVSVTGEWRGRRAGLHWQ